MSHELATDLLAQALEAHSVSFAREDGILRLREAPLALHTDVQKKTTHPNSVVMQVAFAAQAPALAGRTLWTVFAGVGPDEDAAVENGFMKYLLGPFHVVLSALGGHVCAKGNEEWRELSSNSGANWRVCDSPLITQGFDDPTSVPFFSVQAGLEAAFADTPTAHVHWVEAFFAFLDGKRSALDVQLDGEAWPAGTRVLENWVFDPGGGYKSGRYFFIALPS